MVASPGWNRAVKRSKAVRSIFVMSRRRTMFAARCWCRHQLAANASPRIKLTKNELTPSSAVQQQPGISNASLARGAFVTAQSMLGVVANLEKMRLLHRTPHQTHGRIMQSELTQKGTKVLASAREAIDDVEKSMTVGFTAEEIATLRSMLQQCAQNLHSV
jgi:DNA-binding MarR family transcriptional regulator